MITVSKSMREGRFCFQMGLYIIKVPFTMAAEYSSVNGLVDRFYELTRPCEDQTGLQRWCEKTPHIVSLFHRLRVLVDGIVGRQPETRQGPYARRISEGSVLS